MGEILEEHREYALVDRMANLLRDPPKTEFTETFCYAIFSSIIPWICQRTRSPEYRFIFDILEKTLLPDQVAKYFRMEPNQSIPSAGEALVAIRNAISHADGRRVFPINDHGFLKGFKWILTKKQKATEEIIGKLSMRTIGIQSVGIYYADFYCSSIRLHNSNQEDDQFYHAVKVALMEAA